MDRDALKPVIDHAVKVLNEALELDRECLQTLVYSEATTGVEAFIEHPTIQVWERDKDGISRVRVLGLINGLFGADENGWGFISAIVNEETQQIERFMSLLDKRKPNQR